MKRIVLLALLTAIAGPLYAKTQYVTDVLYLSVRAGAGSQFERLETVKSGAALEVLEEGEDYSRVRTPSGTEGWVDNGYLVDEPVAAQKLAQVQQRAERLSQENQELKQNLKNVRGELSKTARERKELSTEAQSLRTEKARIEKAAAEPLKLREQNETLSKDNATMREELDTLRTENARYKEKSARDWFFAGAGVLVGGMLIGLLVPKLRMRRGSDWI